MPTWRAATKASSRSTGAKVTWTPQTMMTTMPAIRSAGPGPRFARAGCLFGPLVDSLVAASAPLSSCSAAAGLGRDGRYPNALGLASGPGPWRDVVGYRIVVAAPCPVARLYAARRLVAWRPPRGCGSTPPALGRCRTPSAAPCSNSLHSAYRLTTPTARAPIPTTAVRSTACPIRLTPSSDPPALCLGCRDSGRPPRAVVPDGPAADAGLPVPRAGGPPLFRAGSRGWTSLTGAGRDPPDSASRRRRRFYRHRPVRRYPV